MEYVYTYRYTLEESRSTCWTDVYMDEYLCGIGWIGSSRILLVFNLSQFNLVLLKGILSV